MAAPQPAGPACDTQLWPGVPERRRHLLYCRPGSQAKRNVSSDKIYRIVFYNQGNVYEVHAHKVRQSELYPFIEVRDIIFGERSKVLIDPSEEKLKSEFSGVSSTHIPMQAVIRIDEVETVGQNKIVSGSGSGNVMPFPASMPSGPKPDNS
jgi:hypothetical protein